MGMAALDGLLEELEAEGFLGQLEGSYGKSFAGACRLGKGRGVGRLAWLGFEKAKDGGCLNRLGWTLSNVKWLLQHPRVVEGVMELGGEIRKKFKYVVFCGMGGSGLSVQVVKSTFGVKGVRLFSLRTTDSAYIAAIQHEISIPWLKRRFTREKALAEGLKKTLVVVVSKSGTTVETNSHRMFFESLFRKAGLNPREHVWLMTDPGPAMAVYCRKGFKVIPIQPNRKTDIGGRFTSPTTSVFLLPLALTEKTAKKAAAKTFGILKQAVGMNDAGDVRNDVFIRLGAFLYQMACGGNDKLTFIVPPAFRGIPIWCEQLFEESLGKEGRGVTVFYGERLSPKVLRNLKENDRVFVRINLGGRKANQKLWKYLSENKYPLFEINARDVNSIGGLMLGLQRAVAAVGYLWGICFVDQPAVEGYKKEAGKMMARLESRGRGKLQTPVDWARNMVSYGKLKLYYHPLVETGVLTRKSIETEVARMGGCMDNAPAVYAAIIRILYHKPGFEASELASYGSMTKKMASIMEQARYSVYTKNLRMSCKLSEGPDKNHSYQQNIEDGRNIFFSTYLMYLKAPKTVLVDYDVNLLKACAIGTIQSMVRNRRKVVLITADSDAQGAERDVERFFREVECLLKPT